jgi:hypothetical protein
MAMFLQQAQAVPGEAGFAEWNWRRSPAAFHPTKDRPTGTVDLGE